MERAGAKGSLDEEFRETGLAPSIGKIVQYYEI